MFSLAQGGQFNLNHLTSADVSLNIWLEEPYGITNTKEVFLDEVRCYSDVDIRGNTHVKDICCENIDVNNSIDVASESSELKNTSILNAEKQDSVLRPQSLLLPSAL